MRILILITAILTTVCHAEVNMEVLAMKLRYEALKADNFCQQQEEECQRKNQNRKAFEPFKSCNPDDCVDKFE